MNRRRFTRVMGAVVAGMAAGAKLAPTGKGDDTQCEGHACKGRNDCRGKGGCKTGDQGCSGRNSCASKGGCATGGGRHDCRGKNCCKGMGGCTASDAGCRGRNSCKGRGGCANPPPHQGV
jgi:hypothetical protein